MAEPPKIYKQYDPDKAFFGAWMVGCGVVLIAFLVGWIVIALFWLR